jgi:addiction module HigA family antidote
MKMSEYIELTTVGEMLKEEFIDAFNISQNALAKAIFVPPNRIHEIVNNKRSITADTDLRLTKYFGLSQGYFLRYQEDYELRMAKRKISSDIDKIKPIKEVNYKQVL